MSLSWNLLLGTPIYSDVGLGQTPTLSGGSWLAALPLIYLQDRRLHRAARSTNLSLANTQFEVDLKTPRPVRVVALPKTNFTLASKVRVRAYTGAGGTGTLLHDSGWLPGVTKPINRILRSEDFSTLWAVIGTPTRTSPWIFSGDVSLDLLGDDSAVAVEGYQQTGIIYIGDGTHGHRFRIFQGTSTTSRVDVTDTTAVVNRLSFLITWSAGVPVITINVAGAKIGNPIPAPNGCWDIEMAATGVIAANNHAIEVYPACDGPATVSLQGNIAIGAIQSDDAPVPREYARTEAAIAGVDSTGMNAGFLYVPFSTVAWDSGVIARYWIIEIDDASNAAGYVDVARLVLAGGVQPTINMSYGLKLGQETETERGVSDGGAALYNVRPNRRTLMAVLDNLPEEEAMRKMYELQRRESLSGQLMVIYDPTDVYHVHRRSFLAVQKELSPLERAMYARDTVPLSFAEEL